MSASLNWLNTKSECLKIIVSQIISVDLRLIKEAQMLFYQTR